MCAHTQYLRILGKRKLWICISSLCTARFPGRNVVLIHYNYRQKSPNCCHLPKLHCCFDVYLEEPHTRHLLLSHQFWRCANRKDGCQFTSSGGLSLKHFQPSASISQLWQSFAKLTKHHGDRCHLRRGMVNHSFYYAPTYEKKMVLHRVRQNSIVTAQQTK